eukprot:6554221-Heterocapsa_arctica.AAC.1
MISGKSNPRRTHADDKAPGDLPEERRFKELRGDIDDHQTVIYFANVTLMGKKAFDHLTAKRAHLRCAAETHLSWKGTEEFMNKTRKQGSKAIVSYPRQEYGSTNERAVHGGVASMWQRHANVKTIREVLGARSAFDEDAYFTDFTAVVIRTKAGQVLVISGYLDPYLGLAGTNITLLSKWAFIIKLC